MGGRKRMKSKNEAANPLGADRNIKKILYKVSEKLQETIEIGLFDLLLLLVWLTAVIIYKL